MLYNIISMHEVTEEDKICVYGATSKEISCDKIAFIGERTITAHHGLHLRPGDSGGPVWVERDNEKYFLGIAISTGTRKVLIDGKEETVEQSSLAPVSVINNL